MMHSIRTAVASSRRSIVTRIAARSAPVATATLRASKPATTVNQACRCFSSAAASSSTPSGSSASAPSSACSAASASAASATSSSDAPLTLELVPRGIAILRFNRPSSLNAMTVAMGELFLRTITDLKADPTLRVVILTGAGKAFSAGGDLDFLLSRVDDTPGNNSAMMRAFYARFLSLLELPVPTIAAINGPAIGAGMCVAAACDLRVAARDTDMGFTFSKLGLHPGMGCTHTLPALIGQQHAARLLLTGEIIKGDVAHKMGLVGDLVESADAVLPAAMALAESIASNSPLCIRTLTTSLRMRHQDNMERALWREADAQAQTYATTELREGVMKLKNRASKKKA